MFSFRPPSVISPFVPKTSKPLVLKPLSFKHKTHPTTFVKKPSLWIGSSFEQEIYGFVDLITAYEKPQRKQLIEQIIAIIQTECGFETLLFGSVAQELDLPDSDIDFAVVFGLSSKESKRKVLSVVKRALIKRMGISSKDNIIIPATIPVLKIIDLPYKIDIICNTRQETNNQIQNVADQVKSNPFVKPLVIVLKQFLRSRNLHMVYEGGMGSYCLVLLTSCFLRIHDQIYHGTDNPFLGICAIVYDLFHFFGTIFDYNQLGLSLSLPNVVFNKLESEYYDKKSPFMLCLIDVDKKDVAKRTFKIEHISSAFRDAFEALSNPNHVSNYGFLGSIMTIDKMQKNKRSKGQGYSKAKRFKTSR
jgi:non-canonical poly(A) RNA polymerase PAPD5/7